VETGCIVSSLNQDIAAKMFPADSKAVGITHGISFVNMEITGLS